MSLVGYGRSHEEAVADLKHQKVLVDAQVSAVGFIFVVFLNFLLSFFHAAMRPVAGSIFFMIIVAIIAGCGWLIEAIDYLPVTIILGLIIFGTVVGGFKNARQAMIEFEISESKLMYNCFEFDEKWGRFVHFSLYIYSFFASMFFCFYLINFIFGKKQSVRNFDFSLLEKADFTFWTILVSSGVIACSIRYVFHPFAKQLTLTGQLRQKILEKQEMQAAD